MTCVIVVGLSLWVQCKFRVAAMNSVGISEPSAPSEAAVTKATVPEVAPFNVSGGGGSHGEQVIVWEPVSEELQNGEKFGYVVAFRLLGSLVWMHSVVASEDASQYVFKNDSFPPLSQFKVKAGVYNTIGEGPYTPVSLVYSGDEEPSIAPTKVWAHSLSFSELQVFWDPILPSHSKSTISGYEVLKEIISQYEQNISCSVNTVSSDLNSMGYFSSDANKMVHIHEVAFLMLSWLLL